MRNLITLLVVCSLSIGGYFLYQWIANIYAVRTIDTSAGTFLQLIEKDEYVLAELQSRESIERLKFKEVFGMPVGEAQVSLTANAYFKYYIKLGELKYQSEQNKIRFKINELYLSAPVAFDSYSLKFSGDSSIFGPDTDEIKEELKNVFSQKLYEVGLLKKSSATEKAAKSLALNFYKFFREKNELDNLIEIEVVFESVGSSPTHVFRFE